jgi:hypothetical protein
MKQNLSTRKLSTFPTALLAGSMALAMPALLNSQTTNATTPPKKPVPATAVKPAPQAKAAVATTTPTAKPVAATQTSATSTTGQSASQVVQPASSTAYQSTGVAGQNVLPASSSAGSVSSVPTAASGQRGAVGLQGVGSFLWGDWTAVIYGCYRSGTRVLCDFDVTKTNPQQANANQLWGGLNLVDNGGRVSARHNAFFMGDDGSQFQTGYMSQTPVRLLMEYDDVSANITSATLVLANQRVQPVPINNVDPSQPAGTIPARGAGQAPAAAAAPAGSAAAGTAPASNNPVDQAQNGVNNAQNQVNNANNQTQKAKSLWNSLKGAAQSTTTTTSH